MIHKTEEREAADSSVSFSATRPISFSSSLFSVLFFKNSLFFYIPTGRKKRSETCARAD
jgi:hypothetical protein